jgi:glucokinase
LRDRIVADIGGSHARFALADVAGRVTAVVFLEVAAFETFDDALDEALRRLGRHGGGDIAAAAVAAAGPVAGDAVQLTNGAWRIEKAGLVRRLGTERVLLVNDFEALALTIPTLGVRDLRQLGGPAPALPLRAPAVVLGPGTGLGVSALVPTSTGWQPLPGEGGHAGLAPASEHEATILAILRRATGEGEVAAETVLSGPGLVRLYDALAAFRDKTRNAPTPPDILAHARQGDALAHETLTFFSAWLGGFAGNVALTVGARGGVFLSSAILRSGQDVFDVAAFRGRFEAKARMQNYLRAIPTVLVMLEEPALIGLARKLAGNEAAPA